MSSVQSSAFESRTITTTVSLSTLSDWSKQHIHDVFEAPNDDMCLRAIESTFARNLKATINGAPLDRESIKQLVLAMRRGSSTGLKVHWRQAVPAPGDPTTNRDGTFWGAYVITGIQKQLPGMSKPAEFERHKTVTVRIESLSSDPYVDSRRIVNLTFVANDVRVDRQATL
ncbi:hypothetical protein BDN71DRAFT_188239 [Pleurotus eryngii]|uniref:Uncharacterized protein n=1 Tax=Pleurotus eryngii TaxID=5323 RepID=A0A9P6DC82_PLEER|nr:hypothetical protein BDN71DRAFT_188239 [Pleurotus eryngii]